MVDTRGLIETFVQLADTLVDDYDVIDVLDQLTHRCVDLLDVHAAGLMLVDAHGHLQLAAASTETARILELLQLQEDEGPCLECFHTGEAVAEPDVSTTTSEWPRFAAAASEAGLISVQAVPMRLRETTIGTLNLFRDRAGTFDELDLRIAQALADAATIGILQHRAVTRHEVLTEQLQTALNSRVIIEQAKGVLAERLGLDMEDAFAVLREQSRARRVRLVELASQVLSGAVETSAFAPTRVKRLPE
ncbi:MAG: GAF and ANTAR domain-containing protein [Actinocatenispora sp.]